MLTPRHHDGRGSLEPAEMDELTDYRFYLAERLSRLNRILALKELGFSLGQISRVLEDDVPAR